MNPLRVARENRKMRRWRRGCLCCREWIDSHKIANVASSSSCLPRPPAPFESSHQSRCDYHSPTTRDSCTPAQIVKSGFAPAHDDLYKLNSECNSYHDLAIHRNRSTVQGSTNRRALGLVNLVPALAYHFCLNLPAAFTQPVARLLVDPCTYIKIHFQSE